MGKILLVIADLVEAVGNPPGRGDREPLPVEVANTSRDNSPVPAAEGETQQLLSRLPNAYVPNQR
jgi:hypothetical protein